MLQKIGGDAERVWGCAFMIKGGKLAGGFVKCL